MQIIPREINNVICLQLKCECGSATVVEPILDVQVPDNCWFCRTESTNLLDGLDVVTHDASPYDHAWRVPTDA